MVLAPCLRQHLPPAPSKPQSSLSSRPANTSISMKVCTTNFLALLKQTRIQINKCHRYTSPTALYVPGSDGEPCHWLTHPGSHQNIGDGDGDYYRDDNGDFLKLILMLNPQYLGPLGYSSLGYTSYRTVRSQNEKQEHKFHNCPVYILHPLSAQCHYCLHAVLVIIVTPIHS